MTAITHLLYLHGFRSSPGSTKARMLCRAVQACRQPVVWWSPQLPPAPTAASALIEEGTQDWPTDRMAVVGSSLGGFYADWLARRRQCRAVFLNPAVHPARDLAAAVGTQTLWHDPAQQFEFRAKYLDQLRALAVPPAPRGAPHLAIIAKGDEVLDWQEMVQQHANAQHVLLEGGDHGLSDFAAHLDQVLAFLGLDRAAAPAAPV